MARSYYAHPKEIYYTEREFKELEIIKRSFPVVEIINPAEYQESPYRPHSDMSFYYGLINSCDIVVYSDLAGFLTAGVAQEVKYALDHGKEVYRLDWRTGQLIKVQEVPKEKMLNIEESQLLLDAIFSTFLDDTEIAQQIDIISSKRGTCFCDTIRLLLKNIDEALLVKRASQDRSLVHVLSRFYHWWQEPDGVRYNVDVSKLKNLLKEKMEASNSKSLRDFVRRELHLTKSRYRFYSEIMFSNDPTKITEIGSLKRLCDELSIPYIELERRDIRRQRFPNRP